MSTALSTLTTNFAAQYGLGSNQQELIETLKATAFKGQVTDAQMTALMLVAQQYKLNPWCREIYAFPDKGGIVPVVGVDGWSRIMNDHPQFDGMEFDQDDEKCTCTIYRKDRTHAIKTTEYLSECKRETQPWKSHPKRMLRHKAMIQCARMAFGFGGIFDQDEAERIIGGEVIDNTTGEITNRVEKTPELPPYTEANYAIDYPDMQSAVNSGKATPQKLLGMLATKFIIGEEWANKIRELKPQSPVVDPFVSDMNAAEERGELQ